MWGSCGVSLKLTGARALARDANKMNLLRLLGCVVLDRVWIATPPGSDFVDPLPSAQRPFNDAGEEGTRYYLSMGVTNE